MLGTHSCAVGYKLKKDGQKQVWGNRAAFLRGSISSHAPAANIAASRASEATSSSSPHVGVGHHAASRSVTLGPLTRDATAHVSHAHVSAPLTAPAVPLRGPRLAM